MYTIKFYVPACICLFLAFAYLRYFFFPFLWTIADYKRKKVHDSAPSLVLHPSTELSSSHNKSWGAGQSHNLNQVALTLHEADPENSVWQRHSWKRISSLYCSMTADKRQRTDFESHILHRWFLSSMDASQAVTVGRQSQWHPLESICH